MYISSYSSKNENIVVVRGHNNDDLPMLRLGDALNNTTKWPMEVLKATSDECNKPLVIR